MLEHGRDPTTSDAHQRLSRIEEARVRLVLVVSLA